MDEGKLIVSQRELHRIHVVRLTLEGRESVERGAQFLSISTRQMKRLRHKMREKGVGSLCMAIEVGGHGIARPQRRLRKYFSEASRQCQILQIVIQRWWTKSSEGP